MNVNINLRSLLHRVTHGTVAAIGWLFFLKGYLAGNWIARIPAVAENIDVARGEFGSVLLLAAIGAIISFQFAGIIVGRLGSAKACRILGIGYVIFIVSFVSSPHVLFFAITLLCFGFFNGSFDISINAQAVEVEKTVHRPIISSMHACFSAGALLGTITGSIFATLGIETLPQMLAIGILALIVQFLAGPHLVTDAAIEGLPTKRARFAIPRGAILPLALIGLCCVFVEEAIADWGALYLEQDLGVAAGAAALGYTTMSLTTLIVRTLGDRIIRRFGPVKVIRSGMTLALVAMASAVAINQPWFMYVAFGLTGLGFGLNFPIIYRTVATMPGVQPASAVASVAATVFLGFIIGPLIMGWVADLASLRVSFGIVTSFLLIAIYLAPSLDAVSKPTTEMAPNPISP